MTTLNVSYQKGLPLHEKLARSIRLFDHNITKQLLEQHPYLVNQSSADGTVAIHNAIKHRNLTALRIILEKPNLDLTEQSQGDHNTPLIAAIAIKDIDFVNAILSNPKSLETFKIKNNICLNALSATIHYDFREAFDVILDKSPRELLESIDCFKNSLITKLIQYQRFAWLHTALKYYQLSHKDFNLLQNHVAHLGNCMYPNECPNKIDSFSSRLLK